MACSKRSLLVFLFLAPLCGIFTNTEAREFLVGGNSKAWSVPTSSDNTLNSWAAENRFHVGDSLVWKYDAGADSVLQVTRAGYLSCNTTDPIVAFRDGSTVVKLESSGAHYFISGVESNCQRGEKLIVVVMSERHVALRRALAPVPAPAPAVGYVEGPAVAPASGAQARTGVFWGFLVVGLGLLGFCF